jgi:hypothetical protein
MGCVEDSAAMPAPVPSSGSNLPVAEGILESKKEHRNEQPAPLDAPYDQVSTTRDIKLYSSSTGVKIKPKKTPGFTESVDDFCRKIFSTYDKDGSGLLSLNEFRKLIRENVSDELTERDVRNLRKSADENEDNKIELKELIDLYKALL